MNQSATLTTRKTQVTLENLWVNVKIDHVYFLLWAAFSFPSQCQTLNSTSTLTWQHLRHPIVRVHQSSLHHSSPVSTPGLCRSSGTSWPPSKKKRYSRRNPSAGIYELFSKTTRWTLLWRIGTVRGDVHLFCSLYGLMVHLPPPAVGSERKVAAVGYVERYKRWESRSMYMRYILGLSSSMYWYKIQRI